MIRLQEARIKVLEEQLRLNKIERFGASSEKDPAQGNFFNEVELLGDEADAAAEEEAAKAAKDAAQDKLPKKKPNKRKPLNPNIPRVQERALLSDEQREGAIDTFFVTLKEELDITPAKVQVIEHLQEKAIYLDENGQRKVVVATRPAHPLGKSILSLSLLAFIIISKYCDGLPLYRLEGILKRYGGSITRSTMASALIRLSVQLQPVVNLLHEVQLTADYLQGDETRLQVLKEHGMDPRGHKWIWVARGGPPDKPVVLFHYNKSREGSIANELLDGFEGRYYQCDGYSGQIAAVDSQNVTVIGCMDHARRKFVKAEKALPKNSKRDQPAKCTIARSMIDGLYRVECEMNKLDLSDDQRKAYRLEHAKPKLDKLHQWLVINSTKVAKDTLSYKAIKYSLNQWNRLIAYCDHGQIHISNVLAENAIRPFVVGRKAWLFADTPRAATASANSYTIIESAKANGIEPLKYILHLCRHIAKAETVDDIEALLPWNVKDQLTR